MREATGLHTDTVNGLCERVVSLEGVVGDMADDVATNDNAPLIGALNRFSDVVEAGAGVPG